MNRLLTNTVFGLGCIVTTTTFANGWRLGFDVAGGGISNGNDQRITLATAPAPGLVNRYDMSRQLKLIFGAGANADYMFHVAGATNTSLGLAFDVFFMPQAYSEGVVKPLVNAGNNFDTLNYGYKMQNYVLMATNEWLWKVKYPLQPYLDLGGGVTFNYMYRYRESVPLGSSASPMLTPFRNWITTQPAVMAGLGINHSGGMFNMRVGYAFYYLGEGKLDHTTAQDPTAGYLKSGAIYLHLIKMTFYLDF